MMDSIEVADILSSNVIPGKEVDDIIRQLLLIFKTKKDGMALQACQNPPPHPNTYLKDEKLNEKAHLRGQESG